MKQAPIKLSEYDPEWPAKFAAEKEFLLRIIGQYCSGSIEHIGSTSVPGAIAKPVIDIMFGVQSLEQSKSAIDILTRNGYVYFPYKNHIMHWFCKPSDEYRTHHLHLVPYQSSLWNERVLFRDLLCSNSSIARAYTTLKIDLAARYPSDREAYTQAKWPLIEEILLNHKLLS